ncbi:MAG: hypothetical protein WCT46_01895 [Candidatus Gracilibacteria bacterium]
MQIVIYITVVIAIIIFVITSALAINHALKFKHLSKRTIYLTYFYVGTSLALIVAILIMTFSTDW